MNKLTLPKSKELELDHQLKQKQLEAGWLGKFIGTGDQPAKVISLIVLLLLIALNFLILYFHKDWQEVTDIQRYTAPIITLIFGYLFGKS